MNRCIAVVSCLAALAAGSPAVIADHRIQNPNLTPQLGRGFSQASYEVLSTCLQFETLTEPTYNYNYDMMEIQSEETSTKSTEGTISMSMSFMWVKANARATFQSSKEKRKHTHMVVTQMSMERYYSSIDDSTATLSPDAASLLAKNDVVGFFQSCGTGYIRSIRRTAEVTAIFEFTSTSEKSAKEAAGSLNVRGGRRFKMDASFAGKSTLEKTDTEMTIKIKAFGLGLNGEGADTLVAHSLEDYHKAIDYAFKSMQNDKVGMIRGIEVVSWANNLQFQNNIDFADVKRIDSSDSQDAAVAEEDGQDVVETFMSGVEVKAITMLNAEFITMMESLYRKQVQNTLRLRNCVAELDLLKKTYSDYYLVDHTAPDFSTKKTTVTVGTLSTVLNTATLKQMFTEAKDFVSNFYGPCLSELTRTSHQGRMTQYFFDLTAFCDAACLEPGKTFAKVDGKINCDTATSFTGADDQGLAGLSYDGILDKYCMPEVDFVLGKATQ